MKIKKCISDLFYRLCFYGTFFKCKIPEGIEIDKGCIPTYDIPIYNAQVIEWEYPEE